MMNNRTAEVMKLVGFKDTTRTAERHDKEPWKLVGFKIMHNG